EHRDTYDASKPYVLLQRNAERTFVAQSGLTGEGMPNHLTQWQALPGPRELQPGAEKLELRLTATASNGDKVVQTLVFHRGSYVIDVAYDLTNVGTSDIAPYAYFQFMRDTKAPGVQSSMAPAAFTGPVLYNENDKYKKIEFGDIDKGKAKFTERTDYGIFTVIAAPLFWLLKWLHGIVHNWGWAIVALTIIIKSAFYPLNHASARSMAKMKVIAPKLKALQQQYADDKQQLQMKMMEL